MSALGQKRPLSRVHPMSVIPPESRHAGLLRSHKPQVTRGIYDVRVELSQWPDDSSALALLTTTQTLHKRGGLT